MTKKNKTTTATNTEYFMFNNSLVDNGVLAELSNAALRVYLVLARRSNSGKDNCYPSYSNIKKSSGLKNDTSVKKGIDELVSKGLVRVVTQGSNITHQSNTYAVSCVGAVSASTTPMQLLADSPKTCEDKQDSDSTDTEGTKDIISVEIEDTEDTTTPEKTELTVEYVYALGVESISSFNLHFHSLESFKRHITRQAANSSFDDALTKYYHKALGSNQ